MTKGTRRGSCRTQLPFDYYYHRFDPQTGAPAGFFDRDPPRTMLRVMSDADLAKLRSKLDGGNYDEVMAVLSPLGWADPENLTLPMLWQRFPVSQQWDLGDLTVYRLRKATSASSCRISRPRQHLIVGYRDPMWQRRGCNQFTV